MNDLNWTYKTFNTDGSVATTTAYWFRYADGLTCAEGEALFNALSMPNRLAQSVAVEPGNEADMIRTVRDCAAVSTDTYVDSTNADYVPVGGGAPSIGATAILVANPAVFNPIVEWSNGKARIRNQATPSIPSGSQPYYFIDGQSYRSVLPTTYDYSPGDEVTIYFTIATNQEPYLAPFNTKGFAQIYIGNAP